MAKNVLNPHLWCSIMCIIPGPPRNATHILLGRTISWIYAVNPILTTVFLPPEHIVKTSPPPATVISNPDLFDQIAYFHGSNRWDIHWESPPDFSLHPSLSRMLDPKQTELVATHLRQIKDYYAAMESAGFFAQTARFVKSTFLSSDEDRPGYPTSAFGAGFSGFDRLDERGWDRAGYKPEEDQAMEDISELWDPQRPSHQIAYFVALGRIFQIPAGHLVAYDPCYSIVDVVLLSTLGVRAFRKSDPGRKALRKLSNPTLFYAPNAEQCVFTDAINRTAPIENLIIVGHDASWCDEAKVFTANYRRHAA
ncbi:hypothetical protein DFH07DRAFT_974666 [Mycena maculata]|uniref:SRR1-like domain-containing protein n=1 Tax=Mycena maculata TaxID=230809 RepID=A0AAD7H735_9AGAR|nr:hypothetical protein DFH07DRAFT_974666 [Mycena maculata]